MSAPRLSHCYVFIYVFIITPTQKRTRLFGEEKWARKPILVMLFYKACPTPELQFLRLLLNLRRLWSLLRWSTQMYLRLHLLDLLDLRSSPTVLPSLLSTPVETMAGPSKENWIQTLCSDRMLDAVTHVVHRVNFLLVDLAGVEPASRSPSLWRDYNNFLIHITADVYY